MITTVVPILDNSDPVANLARYFKEKGAVKAENAISMEHIDWISIVGSGFADEGNLLKLYPFLKKTDSDKFWFDTSTYVERKAHLIVKGKKVIISIGVGLFLLILGMVLVSLVINR